MVFYFAITVNYKPAACLSIYRPTFYQKKQRAKTQTNKANGGWNCDSSGSQAIHDVWSCLEGDHEGDVQESKMYSSIFSYSIFSVFFYFFHFDSLNMIIIFQVWWWTFLSMFSNHPACSLNVSSEHWLKRFGIEFWKKMSRRGSGIRLTSGRWKRRKKKKGRSKVRRRRKRWSYAGNSIASGI